jgi:putative membrane protein
MSDSRGQRRWFPLVLLLFVLGGELALGVHPQADRTTWFLENAPVFILVPFIVATWRRFNLTDFTLTVLTIHAFVLMIGGFYTYAEVPLGFWAQEAFHLSRNHYDRIGHFMQGFGPAIAITELLVKRSPLKPGPLLKLVVISMCLAFSALYELIEWWSAVILGQGADAFLGTQGDPWDTQWDMFLALTGALIATVVVWPLQRATLKTAHAPASRSQAA